jgi:hypothetical protein
MGAGAGITRARFNCVDATNSREACFMRYESLKIVKTTTDTGGNVGSY